ncbi:MAG: D-alanine--D-alanine ligase [Cellvibrionales bacterium]|nr:D-alanine--D-alanine ligase [Cellvibrionales bacterium]
MNTNLMDRKIAVLYGGESSEREVSLVSGKKTLEALADFNAVGLDVPTKDLAAELVRQGIEYCFIALHGGAGEDGTVQAILNTQGIPFSGSDVTACALAMDKHLSKLIFKSAGLPTAPSLTLLGDVSWAEVSQALGDKVILKPTCEGSSVGMQIATDEKSFIHAMALAKEYGDKVLVEKWIDGEELTVGILGNDALPVVRFITPSEFYDYHAKYERDDNTYYCPSGLDEATEKQVQAISLDAFNALGCKGWGRVDLMMDHQGKIQLLEVNTQPGLTSHSFLPMAAKVAGMSFEQLIAAIINQG